jgi:DNA (cytosine-5)-methyltransferase 1
MKPRLLDLFCGAGGCSVGYARAGFEVVGVDIEPQPNYPFPFICGDALEFLRGRLSRVDRIGWELEDFDAIHASPPCQAYTHARHIGNRGRKDHPRLIEPVREFLIETDLPWVIENVEGAELHNPIMLCGSSFGLNVQRHRLFETNFPLMAPGCSHGQYQPARFPGTPRHDGSRPLSKIVNPMASGCSHEDFAVAMGIDWMPKTGFRPTNELREAIPPAFTEHIGSYLLAEVNRRSLERVA